MELQNGYKVIYNARQAVTEEKPNLIYGSKSIPALDDPMCHYYGYKDNTDRELTPADIRLFKLIYSDNEYIYGSLTGIPAEDDEVLVIKDASNVVVFGKELDTTPRHSVTIAQLDNAKFTGAGKYKEGAKFTVSIAAADGYMFDTSAAVPTCKVDESSVTLTKDGDSYVSDEIEMGQADINVVFTATFKVKPVAQKAYAINIGATKNASDEFVRDTVPAIGTDWNLTVDFKEDATYGKYAEATFSVPTGKAGFYFGLALNKNVGTITEIYASEDTSHSQNLIVNCDEAKEDTYLENTYSYRVAKDQDDCASITETTLYFFYTPANN